MRAEGVYHAFVILGTSVLELAVELSKARRDRGALVA